MNLAFDLFLLMFNLAQLHEKEKIIELFMGGIGEVFKPIEFRYSKEGLKNESGYEIRTAGHFFGSIEIKNPEVVPAEYPLLIQNAILMLGIVLERLELSEKLEEERNYYKQAANQRFEELEKNIAELNNAKAASLNLINDLTEEIESRARIEKQLSESEDQILLLLNSTAEAIYGLDNEGKCTFCNKACLRILGYSEVSELIGKNMHNMIHHTRRDNTPLPEEECQIYKAFKREESIHEDSEVLWRKDGTSFFAEYWSYPIKREGKIIGSVVTFVDITERKRAEENLRETKDYLESLIRYANAPIIVWDNTLIITKFNDAFEKLTGRKKKDVIGKGLEILFPEEKKKKSLELIKKTLLGMQWETVEIEILNVDGCIRTVLWNSANIYDAKKENIIATIAQGNDITGRKRAEEQLWHLNTQLHILIEAVKSLSEARNLESIEKIITGYARELSNAEAATIAYREGDFSFYAEEDSIQPLWKNNKFPINECIGGWVMTNSKAAMIKDIYKDERIPLANFENTFVKSLIMLPVKTPEAIAAIGCYWGKNYEPTEIEVQLLQTLADSAGRPIENIRLYKDLERKVEEKTIELRERLKELERFYNATIDREMRMKELRDEIDELKKKAQNG